MAISLAALQPVATRLQQLHLAHSRLQGSADGFLSTGWTALTSLTLLRCRMKDQALPEPNMPALEAVDLYNFVHRGGMLQLHELIGGCPQLTRLCFDLDGSLLQGGKNVQQCSLLNLGRLANLQVAHRFYPANLGFDLPASLTTLRFVGLCGDHNTQIDFFLALLEAAKCIKGGAQLHTLYCSNTEAFPQSPQWGASLREQYGQLGGQLSGLQELEVWGYRSVLLSALSAVASSAPSLTRLIIGSNGFPCMELPPICSGSLESLVFRDYEPQHSGDKSPLPVILTALPGCIRLREVLVQRRFGSREGAVVKICCHCRSQRCIVPLDVGDGLDQIVGIQILPSPACARVQGYTVLYTCHAAGPEQHPRWGCVVAPMFM